MRDRAELNGLDRADPPRRGADPVRVARRSRAASRTSGRLRLPGRRQGGQPAPRVRERAPRESGCASLEQHEAENRRLRRLLELRESVAGRPGQRAGRRQGLHRVFPRRARDARSRRARHRPEHAGHLAGRRGRQGAARRGRHASTSLSRRRRQRRRRRGRAHRRARLRPRHRRREHATRARSSTSQRTDEVEVGDLLVTSGMGRRFPEGHPGRRA